MVNNYKVMVRLSAHVQIVNKAIQRTNTADTEFINNGQKKTLTNTNKVYVVHGHIV